MSDQKCPLCGKPVQDDDTFCQDCKEIARNEYPEHFFTHSEKSPETKEQDSDHAENTLRQEITTSPTESQINTEYEEDEMNTATVKNIVDKNNKRSGIFLFIGLIALVCVGIFGSYMFVQNRNAAETEAAFWNKCVEENTPLSYSKYLVQYPEGTYSEEAQDKILDLRKMEDREWEALQKSEDINAYAAFLTDHPDTPYAAACKQKMDSLSWVAAQAANTADAYLAYLENVNLGNLTGDYKELAQEKYDYLSQLKVVDGEELKDIQKNISAFFGAISNKKMKDLAALLSPLLNNFFGAVNVSNNAVIESIESEMKARNIKNVTYTANTDSINAILDNKGIYFMDLPIKRETTFNDRKKAKETSEMSIHIEMNDKKQIQSLYEN